MGYVLPVVLLCLTVVGKDMPGLTETWCARVEGYLVGPICSEVKRWRDGGRIVGAGDQEWGKI